MLKHLIAQVDISDTPCGPGGNVSTVYPQPATLVNIIVKNSLIVAGIIFLGLLVAGGVMMIASAGSGDQKKAAISKSLITDAAIGFLVIFTSYFIIQIIEILTGINIL